jgi:hypothetical protein
MPVADLCVTSDAAGAIGYGALWMPSQMPMSIAYKEFFPVVIAAHLWGDQWANSRGSPLPAEELTPLPVYDMAGRRFKSSVQ